MNAITFYYLGQYLVVFVISYFRIRKAFQIQDPGIPDSPKFNWKPVFFVSLELVYTSAGFIIVLIQDSKDWTPVIIIFYIILILISSNLSSIEERFSERTKLVAHLSITGLIIISTILVFNVKKDVRYQISIPFADTSINHLTNKRLKRNYYTVIKASTEIEALDSAILKFWADKYTDPIIKIDSVEKKQMIEIYDKEIIIKESDKWN